MESTSSKVLYFFAVVLIILGIMFCTKGFDKKNNYNEYNKYVGGDAYNFIVNGTYFSGYSTLAAGMFIIAAIFISTGIMINTKEDHTNAIILELSRLQRKIENPQGDPLLSNTKLDLAAISRSSETSNSSGMWTCSDCGDTNPSSSRICRGCGKYK